MQEEVLFEKYNNGRHWEKRPTIYAEKFVDFLKEKNFNGLIIDIGCGNGRDVNVFTQASFDAWGIDYLQKEIDIAKNKFPQISFEVQNVESLEFEDNSVDAFFMINVIHYVEKIKAMKEILRTLKSKGYFFIHFNIEIVDKAGKVDYSHSEEEIMKLVSEFKIVHKKVFERIDKIPVEHKHKIIELILQKE